MSTTSTTTSFIATIGGNNFSFSFTLDPNSGSNISDRSWEILALNIKTKQQYRALIDASLSSVRSKNAFELQFLLSNNFVDTHFLLEETKKLFSLNLINLNDSLYSFFDRPEEVLTHQNGKSRTSAAKPSDVLGIKALLYLGAREISCWIILSPVNNSEELQVGSQALQKQNQDLLERVGALEQCINDLLKENQEMKRQLQEEKYERKSEYKKLFDVLQQLQQGKSFSSSSSSSSSLNSSNSSSSSTATPASPNTLISSLAPPTTPPNLNDPNDQVIEGLMNKLKSSQTNPSVVQSTLAEIYNLSKDKPETIKSIVYRNGIEMIVDAMKRFMGNPQLIESASGLIWNISLEEENQIAIGKVGGVVALLDVLKKFPMNTTIVLNVNAALRKLVLVEENGKAIVSNRGLDLILASLKRFTSNPNIVANALLIISNLAVIPQNQEMLALKGSIEEILGSMKAFHNNSQIIENALGGLWNLSADENNKTIIVKKGAVDEILKVMKAFPTNPSLQELAIGCIWSLAVNEDVRNALLNKGGIELIVDGISQFLEDLQFIETALSTVWCLLGYENPEILAKLKAKNIEEVMGKCGTLYAAQDSITEKVQAVMAFLQ